MLRINLLTSINPAKLRDKINEIIHWMWRNELVPGHGIRIDRKVNGIIVSADPPVGGRSGNGSSSVYTGAFEVTLETGEEKPPGLKIGKGFVNVNGVFFATEETTLPPEEGTLCVTASVRESEWKITAPEFVFHDPDREHYPIAAISSKDDVWQIRQYPVTVAVLLLVKTCIFAKAAQNG